VLDEVNARAQNCPAQTFGIQRGFDMGAHLNCKGLFEWAALCMRVFAEGKQIDHFSLQATPSFQAAKEPCHEPTGLLT